MNSLKVETEFAIGMGSDHKDRDESLRAKNVYKN